MRNALFAILALLAAPAHAGGLDRVTDRAEFIDLVAGKTLKRTGVALVVTPSGKIGGRAFGFDVSGAWTWKDGLFCRTLAAAGRAYPHNCQLVEVGGDRIRFTSDGGTGQFADLAIH